MDGTALGRREQGGSGQVGRRSGKWERQARSARVSKASPAWMRLTRDGNEGCKEQDKMIQRNSKEEVRESTGEAWAWESPFSEDGMKGFSKAALSPIS